VRGGWDHSPTVAESLPHTGWESLLIRAGWQRSEILATPADEVLAHIVHTRRALSEERLFALHAAAYPETDPAAQRRLYAATQAIADFGRPRVSAYERVSDSERILMIGGDATAAPEAFPRAHPEQIRWLTVQGITLEEAIRRHDEWLTTKLKDLRS
jgi:hypothetical protein